MSVIEKAFALAQSGQFATADEVERHMRKAGLCNLGDLDGRDLRKRLRSMCDEARGGMPTPAPSARPRKVQRKTRPILFS